jgi:hypothetical protein
LPGSSKVGSDQTSVRVRTLDAIVARADWGGSVRRSDLRTGDWLVITTKNSVYSICVLGEGLYSVSGGWFDRQGLSPLQTTINGCTWGGSAIRDDIVAAPGLCVEFGNQVMTSRVRQVRIIRGGERQAVS